MHEKKTRDAKRRGPRREDAYCASSRLRGVDLIEQVATNTKVQKQRWIEIYYRLSERKAKIDIADSIVIEDGVLRDWFFTSSVTGEIQRQPESRVNALAIKKHFVRTSDSASVVRQIASLLHEDATGNIVYSVLNDLDFNIALGQPASPPWTGSFLLQPFFSTAQQHPQCSGVYVGKFNTSTSTSVRVSRSDRCFYDLARYGDDPRSRSDAATVRKPDRHPPHVLSRGVEELIRAETHKVAAEIEAASQDSLRQLHVEFQITRSHRLVLVRVTRVVFASDLNRTSRDGGSPSRTRPSSAGSGASSKRCAGRRFCHCKPLATGEITKTSVVLVNKASDLQQITRRSLQLCDEESLFLDKFGAHAEAHLDVVVAPTASTDAHEAFKRVLQRRMFMLRSTLWNPDSDSFGAKPLAWEDERTRQPQQYEMVRVCHSCYLIYHAMDAERFQATKSTVKAAVRRLTMLHNAKMLGGMRAAWPAEASE